MVAELALKAIDHCARPGALVMHVARRGDEDRQLGVRHRRVPLADKPLEL
jgi:hypothetical protein